MDGAALISVAPLAGARIETSKPVKSGQISVAPLAGARIETSATACASAFLGVAPLAGARIETALRDVAEGEAVSLPSRERELKLYLGTDIHNSICRFPRRSDELKSLPPAPFRTSARSLTYGRKLKHE